MTIVDLEPNDPAILAQVVELLVDGFRDTGSTSWRNPVDALEEVKESLEPGRISRVAVHGDGRVLGWIGGIAQYDGHVWELHPLVVRRDCRRQGIGRALVADLEAEVARRGGCTVTLGTDDENGRTSLGGIDLYPDVLDKLRSIDDVGGHPFGFYRSVGYTVVGAIPDANGFGKPDILMAKRVGPPPAAR